VAKHPDDFPAVFRATASVGGNIDTTWAIVGITATCTGVEGVPADCLERSEPLPQWAPAT